MILKTDRGKAEFQIDASDFETVRRYFWAIDDEGYVHTHAGRAPKLRNLRLHLFLLGPAPAGLMWDHRNRDKTDNRRRNLRAVTPSINTYNGDKWRTNTSGIRGVCWHKRHKKWIVSIGSRPLKFLGYFDTLEEAAKVRRQAEKEIGF